VYEEEIDLRIYIDVLLRRRRLILTLTVGMALIAAIVSFLLPPTYEARSALSVAPRRSNITLTEDFTLSEEEINQLTANQRAEALTEIAKSLKVAQIVLETAPNLDEGGATPHALVESIEVSTKDDLLIITAAADTPQKAADLATAWTEATRDQINQIYAFDPETVGEIQEQTEATWETYLTAQQALQTFLSESDLSTVESRIKIVNNLLQEYENTLAKSISAQYTEPLFARRDRLKQLYAQINLIDQYLTNAQALKNQVTTDASSADTWGTSLAFINLQSQAFSWSVQFETAASNWIETTPVESENGVQRTQTAETSEETVKASVVSPSLLQFDLNGTAPELSTNDIERFISTLQRQKAAVQEQATTLRQEIHAMPPVESDSIGHNELQQQIENLNKELATLQAQLEEKEAERSQLTEARDVAWTTYTSLANKAREVNVEKSVSASESRLAFEAMPPANPSAPNKKLNTAVAGALGLMLGVFGAFMIEYLVPKPGPETLRNFISRWLLAEAPGLPNFDPGQQREKTTSKKTETPAGTDDL